MNQNGVKLVAVNVVVVFSIFEFSYLDPEIWKGPSILFVCYRISWEKCSIKKMIIFYSLELIFNT